MLLSYLQSDFHFKKNGFKLKAKSIRMSQINKRQFLHLLGSISLGLLPMMSCYEKKEAKLPDINEETDQLIKKDSLPPAIVEHVSESDIILLTRNQADYEQYNINYNKQINHLPKYIAVCKTEKGIAHAIQLARHENLPIAVKSGGHSFEGFSTNEGGMVINVSQMKQVKWISDYEVEVGAGLKLSEVHDLIYAKGKLLPAGSCGGVGIAGLALGGGYGFFSRKHGLTCDSLLSLRMVDADGNLKTVSAKDDLMWACRGAGNGNFGVVSSMHFKLYSLPKNFASHNIYYRKADAHTFTTVLQQWFEATTQLSNDCFAAFVLNGKTIMMLFTNYGTQNIEAIIAPLKAAATTWSHSSKPTLQAIKRFYGRKEPLYFKNASCGYYNGFDDLKNISEEIFNKAITSAGMVFQINTMGGNINNENFKKASAFPHREMQYLGELQSYYETAGRFKRAADQFESMQALLKQNGINKHYANYPSLNFTNWQQAYYGNNYERLQQIKKTVDPENVFRYAQSIEIS